MCDPISMLVMALGAAAGSKGSKPPAATLPAPDTQDAKEETGAEVVLGGEEDLESGTASSEDEATLNKTTGATGLKTSAKKTGINIL